MNKRYQNPDFGYGCSRNYFSGRVLPVKAELKKVTIGHMTSYSQRDGLELIYIKEGTGNLIVNNKSYAYQEGDCFSLYFYHFYKLKPDQNSTVVMTRCLVDYSSYLFIFNNPYFIDQIRKPSQEELLMCNFIGNNKIAFEHLWKELEVALKTDAPYQEYSTYFLFVELWGKFTRNAIRL